MAPAMPFVWETVATATVQGMWFNLYINLTGAHGAFHTLSVPARVKTNLYLTKQIHPIYYIYFNGCFSHKGCFSVARTVFFVLFLKIRF